MKYIRLSVNTTSEFSHLVADKLFSLGSLGIAISDANDLKDVIEGKKYWDYIEESAFNYAPYAIVTGFFDEGTDMANILEQINNLKGNEYFDTGSLEISYALEDSTKYEDVWKQYYKPIEIGRVTIVPKWIPFSTQSTIPVILDPGSAFGTGGHETTALCVELLQQVPNLKKLHALDMGCGSGILGITALNLGAKSVDFVDVDPIATKASFENASLNKVEKKGRYMTGSFENADLDLKPPYHLILANLTAEWLIKFYPCATRLLDKSGHMVISGILDSKTKDVLEYYNKSFSVVEQKSINGWSGFLLQSNKNNEQ